MRNPKSEFVFMQIRMKSLKIIWEFNSWNSWLKHFNLESLFNSAIDDITGFYFLFHSHALFTGFGQMRLNVLVHKRQPNPFQLIISFHRRRGMRRTWNDAITMAPDNLIDTTQFAVSFTSISLQLRIHCIPLELDEMSLAFTEHTHTNTK